MIDSLRILNPTTNILHTGYVCKNIGNATGFEYPTSRIAIEDVAGITQSAFYLASKSGRRRLSWECIVDDPQDRRLLLAECRAGQLKWIYFETCDGLALQAQIEVENVVMPVRQGRQRALIEAVAPDWRFYAQNATEITTQQTSVAGGLAIPAEVPFDMGGQEQTTGLAINAGNDITIPTLTIYGPGNSFNIGNTTTGQTFTLNFPIQTGEYIDVNMQDRTVLLNGTTNIYNSITSGGFFYINPGENILQFEVVGSDIDTLLVINWNNAYVGI